MLVINYNGNKPIANYFKYGVEGNNNADIVRFVVLKKQGGLDLTDNFLVYVKCDNESGFVDKVEIESANISVHSNCIFVDWHLLKKHTEQENLRVSLCFENESETVWQTQAFQLKLLSGVNADEEIPNTYPSVIQQMESEITALKGKKLYKHNIRIDYSGIQYNGSYTSYTIFEIIANTDVVCNTTLLLYNLIKNHLVNVISGYQGAFAFFDTYLYLCKRKFEFYQVGQTTVVGNHIVLSSSMQFTFNSDGSLRADSYYRSSNGIYYAETGTITINSTNNKSITAITSVSDTVVEL